MGLQVQPWVVWNWLCTREQTSCAFSSCLWHTKLAQSPIVPMRGGLGTEGLHILSVRCPSLQAGLHTLPPVLLVTV